METLNLPFQRVNLLTDNCLMRLDQHAEDCGQSQYYIDAGDLLKHLRYLDPKITDSDVSRIYNKIIDFRCPHGVTIAMDHAATVDWMKANVRGYWSSMASDGKWRYRFENKSSATLFKVFWY